MTVLLPQDLVGTDLTVSAPRLPLPAPQWSPSHILYNEFPLIGVGGLNYQWRGGQRISPLPIGDLRLDRSYSKWRMGKGQGSGEVLVYHRVRAQVSESKQCPGPPHGGLPGPGVAGWLPQGLCPWLTDAPSPCVLT